MKTYDCFTFFNELDLLEIRLNELNDVVDYFVLVESKKTFQNNYKPYYFYENKDRFKKFNDKIITLNVPDELFCKNPWQNEETSWNYLINGLTAANDEDIILVSAVDEIPHSKIIDSIKKQNVFPYCVIMDLYYFYLNTKFSQSNSTKWHGTFATKYNLLNKNNMYSFNADRKHVNKIEGGWHFSFLGDAKNTINKVHSYSHSEFNHFNEEYYFEKIKNLEDVFGRGQVKFDSFMDIKLLPTYVQNNIEKCKNYLKL
jgi:beta-1,4-mannosyl-glycoprotein beta-1,4-N-acetylglucosaminyltransferase